MSDELLSQGEVDALLKGVDGASFEPGAAAPSNGPPPGEPPSDGIRAFDLARQERIVRARMPALEMINEGFARLLRTGLFRFMRREPAVSVAEMRTIKYDEFVRGLAMPSSLNIVQLKPLRGSALFVFDPGLLFTVIENLFGGDGRFQTQTGEREFTPTEQRIIQRMLAVVLEEYAKSWHPVHPLRFEYIRTEAQVRLAAIAAPNDNVVVSSFPVALGSGGGALHICIPYATLEPIRGVLCATGHTEPVEPDRRWLRMLSKQVQTAEVEVAAHLTSIPVRIRELLNMKVGDVVAFDLPDTVNAEVDGVPIFECRYGTLNSQYALKIERVLAVAPQDNSLGDDHAA